MNKHQSLTHLLFHLERANYSYERYKENPVFLHAKAIFKANDEILKLASSYAPAFSVELRQCLIKLIVHLDVWSEQFMELEKELKPALDTQFVFQRYPGTQAFPMNLHSLIKKELES